jgi:hypothetical protein
VLHELGVALYVAIDRHAAGALSKQRDEHRLAEAATGASGHDRDLVSEPEVHGLRRAGRS